MIRHKKRNELKEYLKNNSVETLIHYPIPIHKQKAYRELNHLSFSVTEKIHSEILSLPIYATLGENEIREIVSVINTFN